MWTNLSSTLISSLAPKFKQETRRTDAEDEELAKHFGRLIDGGIFRERLDFDR